MRSICRTNEEHSHIQYQTAKAMNMNDVSVTKSSIVSLQSTHMKFKLQTPRRLKATSNLSKPASVFTLRISYSLVSTHTSELIPTGFQYLLKKRKLYFHSHHLSVELQARNKLQYRVRIYEIMRHKFISATTKGICLMIYLRYETARG
jgi:hypothetical protein